MLFYAQEELLARHGHRRTAGLAEAVASELLQHALDLDDRRIAGKSPARATGMSRRVA